ncbi:MAG: heparinase II/III family protein [Thermoguttaceae bacterium]|jgi:hypothetical protein|nr:heparinase II/III family protein [Thermoguttaceae bacterium]
MAPAFRACRRPTVFVLVLGLVSSLSAAAQEKATSPASAPAAEQLLKMLKPGHPRLLIDQAGFDALKRKLDADRELADWDKTLRREADALVTAPLPKHALPDGKRLLDTSRRVLGRTYTLALAYRLHGDAKHLERLWRELETVAAFPDFNPSHFLDTAEMTHALAIAYDWLYRDWTDAQRATIREAIVRHGLKPGLAVYRRKGGWPRSAHNWNQVCNGGMTVGALAIADEEPALAGEILRHALASVPLAMRSYAPDGAWGEGPGYWGYATTYNVVMLAALESALGSDFALSKMEGFAETGLFPIYMTGPTGRAFNFEDSGERIGRMDCLLWLARRFDRPELIWHAMQGRPSAAGMIWYRGPGKDPQTAGLPLDKYWRGVEVATMRSRWNDPQAVFVGFLAGSNRINHNHLDSGSFVLDALGQRWVVDLGADNYNLPGYFGGQRYTYYRLRAEGHNTLVLNPSQAPDQDPRSETRIRRFTSEKDRAAAVADLTPAYAVHARRVERGIALLDRQQVLVQDEIETSKPADVWWFVHTEAAIQVSDDGRSVTLEQGGRKLVARLVSPAEGRFEVRPAAPLPSSPNPEGQRPNRQVRNLTVHLPQITTVRLATLFAPEGQSGQRPVEVKPLAQW